jgi:hypothetical protein
MCQIYQSTSQSEHAKAHLICKIYTKCIYCVEYVHINRPEYVHILCWICAYILSWILLHMTNHTWLGLEKNYIIWCSIIHLQTPSATSFIEQDAEKKPYSVYWHHSHHLYRTCGYRSPSILCTVAQLVTHWNCRAAGSIPAGGSIVVFFATALGLKKKGL